MRYLLTSLLCVFTLSLTAQEPLTYPYNPDSDNDQYVAVSDVLNTISAYGSPFSPAEIMVGDTALSEWIQILYQALQDQQAFSIVNTNSGDVDLYNDGLVRIWLDDSTTDDIELEIINVFPFPPGASYHVSWTTSSAGSSVYDLNANGIVSTATLDFDFTTDEIMTLRIWSPVAGMNFPYYEATLIKSSALYSGAPLLTSVTKSII